MGIRKVYESRNSEMMAESLEYLRKVFPRGTEVRTIVKHVNKSGTARAIVVLAVDNGSIVDVSAHVARVTESLMYDDGGVWVKGGGMDMCFALVYDLARTLHNDEVRDGTDAGYELSSRPI